MIADAAATAAGLWGVRALVHRAILHGLRAPRTAHRAEVPRAAGAGPVVSVRFAGPRGRQLFGRWLQPGVDASRLALAGHSVGAGAALLCATRRDDLAAVLSLSAFAHPREVMRRWLAAHRVPYPMLGWSVMRHVQRVIGARFDDIAPLASMARVRCPVLLVHGRDDETVPFAEARRLQAASAGRAALLPLQAGHDIGDALAAHADEVMRFLRGAFDAARPAACETR